jgi:hypothetical protein
LGDHKLLLITRKIKVECTVFVFDVQFVREPVVGKCWLAWKKALEARGSKGHPRNGRFDKSFGGGRDCGVASRCSIHGLAKQKVDEKAASLMLRAHKDPLPG